MRHILLPLTPLPGTRTRAAAYPPEPTAEPRVLHLDVPVDADAEPFVDGGTLSRLDLWRLAVHISGVAVLLVDEHVTVIAASRPAAELFGTTVDRMVGRPLLASVTLLDFMAGLPTTEYAERIPPIFAAREGVITRGLIRVAADSGAVTVDAVAAPLLDDKGEPAGAIAFLSDVAAATPRSAPWA